MSYPEGVPIMTTEDPRTTLTQVETPVDTRVDDIHEHFGELFAHYIHPEDTFTKVLMGLPVTAYCGFTWIATRFIDHGELPTCPACVEAFAARGWA
jgi:Protein of unknown function (DUF3039)